ncbi:MAG: pseudouridine synthase [Myxococcota bacterium]
MSDAPPETVRLNRWFTEHGVCSRREADRWIADGRVTVNGVPAALGTQVGPADRIAVDGQLLEHRVKRPIVIAYNKPVGIQCTSDPSVRDNIIDAVEYPERLVHVGRLDQMSEGLILLTNRGDIVNLILRAEFDHEKEYVVDLSENVSDEQVGQLSRGIDIGDDRGRTKPCKVVRLGPSRLSMTLTEGRNRQIRRMAEALGLHVKRLERVRIMHIRLGSLARGKWRHLSDNEMRDLWFRLGLDKPKLAPRKRPTTGRPRPSAPAPKGRMSHSRGPRPRD